MKTVITLLLMGVALFGQGVGVNTALVSTPPPPNVIQSFVRTVGTTGRSNYCYFVVAVYPVGMAQAGPPTCLANSNGTLSGANYNTISWSAPSASVSGYWVIRSSNTVFPATGTTAVNAVVLSAATLTLNDQANALNAFTYSPASVAIGQLEINNKDASLPYFRLSYLTNPGSQIGLRVGNNSTIDGSGAVTGGVYNVVGNIAIADINTGKTILAGVTGRTLRVVGFEFQAIGGAFATCTLVQIVDTTGTPVVSVGVPIADLTQNTIVTASSANVVFTTYAWQGQLGAGQGLAINKTGGGCATATSMNYNIRYQIN